MIVHNNLKKYNLLLKCNAFEFVNYLVKERRLALCNYFMLFMQKIMTQFTSFVHTSFTPPEIIASRVRCETIASTD